MRAAFLLLGVVVTGLLAIRIAVACSTGARQNVRALAVAKK